MRKYRMLTHYCTYRTVAVLQTRMQKCINIALRANTIDNHDLMIAWKLECIKYSLMGIVREVLVRVNL